MSTRAPAIPNASNGNSTVGQAATAALGADAPEVVVNGVFLSPRVIDRRAYGELAGELRDLVERSAAERAGLSAALERASRAAQEFRQHEQSQSGNLELAARALRTFDERTTKVEAILSKAASQTQLFEKLEAHAGGLIDEKIQALEARLDAVTSAATAKTEALEERIRRASRELEQRIEAIRRDAQSIAGPAQEALARQCEKAAALTGREPGSNAPPATGSLLDLMERGERLAAQADEAARGLERFTHRAAQIQSELDEVAQRQDEVEKRTIQMGTQINHRQSEIDRKFADLGAHLEQRQEELDRRGIELGEQINQRQGAIERRAADLTTQVEKHGLEITSQMERRGNEITAQAERRSAEMGTQIERNLEIVRSRLTQLQNESIARAQGTIDEAQRLLDQVQTGTPVSELRSVIQQAADAHSTTSLAIKVLDKSLESAKGITAALEPWRGVLDSHEPGKMPEPIRRMVEGVRGDLHKELSTIASALRNAADKADRAVRGVAEAPEQYLPATPVAPTPTSYAPAPKASTILKGSAIGNPAAGHPLVGARVNTPATGPDPADARRPRAGDAAD